MHLTILLTILHLSPLYAFVSHAYPRPDQKYFDGMCDQEKYGGFQYLCDPDSMFGIGEGERLLTYLDTAPMVLSCRCRSNCSDRNRGAVIAVLAMKQVDIETQDDYLNTKTYPSPITVRRMNDFRNMEQQLWPWINKLFFAWSRHNCRLDVIILVFKRMSQNTTRWRNYAVYEGISKTPFLLAQLNPWYYSPETGSVDEDEEPEESSTLFLSNRMAAQTHRANLDTFIDMANYHEYEDLAPRIEVLLTRLRPVISIIDGMHYQATQHENEGTPQHNIPQWAVIAFASSVAISAICFMIGTFMEKAGSTRRSGSAPTPSGGTVPRKRTAGGLMGALMKGGANQGIGALVSGGNRMGATAAI